MRRDEMMKLIMVTAECIILMFNTQSGREWMATVIWAGFELAEDLPVVVRRSALTRLGRTIELFDK